jgi:hypothetical protein
MSISTDHRRSPRRCGAGFVRLGLSGEVVIGGKAGQNVGKLGGDAGPSTPHIATAMCCAQDDSHWLHGGKLWVWMLWLLLVARLSLV